MIKGILLAIALSADICLGAMQPGDFSYQRILTAPDSSSEKLASCRLDSLVYRHTSHKFTTMRIFDESGKKISFVVREITANDTDTVLYPVRLESEDFHRTKGGGASVVYSREKDDSIPTQLTIATVSRNFEKSVTVLGSNDRSSWEILVKNQPIFDYTQFIDIRNTTVEFIRADFKFYKVEIDSVWSFKRSAFSRIVHASSGRSIKTQYTEFIQLQEPFRLDQISFSAKSQKGTYGEPINQTSELRIDTVFQDTSEKTTALILSSNREPVNKLKLSVANRNFMRHVLVYATNDSLDNNVEWKRIGSGDIVSISTGTYERSELKIPVRPASRYLHYKLSIVNNDNAPVSVSAVSGEGGRHEVLFFHGGSKKVRMYYGAKDLDVPHYDIASVLHEAPVTTGARWALGSEKKLSSSGETVDRFNPKYVLMGILGLMVVVLLLVLGVAVRKVDEKTDVQS